MYSAIFLSKPSFALLECVNDNTTIVEKLSYYPVGIAALLKKKSQKKGSNGIDTKKVSFLLANIYHT